MSYMAERVVGTGSFGVVYQVLLKVQDAFIAEIDWLLFFIIITFGVVGEMH